MIDKDIILSIGVSWYNRAENLLTCSNKLYEFLTILKKYKPEYFSNWYEGDTSKKRALEKKVEITLNYIKKHLSNKSLDEEYPKYCYQFGLWNGNPVDSLSSGISACLGGAEKKLWTNNFIISFPYEGPQMEYYRKPENVEEILQIMINFWEPEHYNIGNVEDIKKVLLKK